MTQQQNNQTNQNRNQEDTTKRGFANMDEEKQRDISKKGGENSHTTSK